jgi:hypothetical protein
MSRQQAPSYVQKLNGELHALLSELPSPLPSDLLEQVTALVSRGAEPHYVHSVSGTWGEGSDSPLIAYILEARMFLPPEDPKVASDVVIFLTKEGASPGQKQLSSNWKGGGHSTSMLELALEVRRTIMSSQDSSDEANACVQKILECFFSKTRKNDLKPSVQSISSMRSDGIVSRGLASKWLMSSPLDLFVVTALVKIYKQFKLLDDYDYTDISNERGHDSQSFENPLHKAVKWTGGTPMRNSDYTKLAEALQKRDLEGEEAHIKEIQQVNKVKTIRNDRRQVVLDWLLSAQTQLPALSVVGESREKLSPLRTKLVNCLLAEGQASGDIESNVQDFSEQEIESKEAAKESFIAYPERRVANANFDEYVEKAKDRNKVLLEQARRQLKALNLILAHGADANKIATNLERVKNCDWSESGTDDPRGDGYEPERLNVETFESALSLAVGNKKKKFGNLENLDSQTLLEMDARRSIQIDDDDVLPEAIYLLRLYGCDFSRGNGVRQDTGRGLAKSSAWRNDIKIRNWDGFVKASDGSSDLAEWRITREAELQKQGHTAERAGEIADHDVSIGRFEIASTASRELRKAWSGEWTLRMWYLLDVSVQKRLIVVMMLLRRFGVTGEVGEIVIDYMFGMERHSEEVSMMF